MEFIKDITVTIDKAYFEDCARLKKIISSYSYENKTSSYKVSGKFEELENMVDLLKRNQASVTVSALVMEYIQQKYAETLKKIKGKLFTIEIRPCLSAQLHKTVQVTFGTQSESSYPPSSVSLEFVKQRFITFYQRTASDLQVAAFTLNPHDTQVFQKQFPFLLFQTSSSKTVTVIGPFANLQKLKAVISQNPPNLSSSQKNRVPEPNPSGKSSSSSSKQSKHNEDEPCPICMEPIRAGRKETLGCKHSFCSSCLKKAFDFKPVCPICGKVYGILKGIQPEGVMNITKTPSFLPGYEAYETIIIHYHIPSGIQKEEHPNPGQAFEGVSRTAYLPDSPEGRKILQLLKQAFDQRLTFTIGQSTTSGRSNVVTWNDIHHKTSTHGGPTLFGYPDPEYLSRVREELKVKGVE
ncbi:probable E3 ubiquitin-protein ligase DTX3 [Austrofundulus limnaeus]|uniref:E3 ubiquitin-protein ligase n=1 Tax=Austrofundulus limnaeus TaxID=52670 RepID=A0A2I4BLW8_AUSLI|nr:PREDICTED: probable E3 ubiquitin-protein ligase DTX3 [Austrofundulus limnaeus]